MSEKVLDVTVSEFPTKEDLRDAVYEEYDVSQDGRVVGAVFGDADRAPGSQNTIQHNGAAQPKTAPGLITKNQVPAQVVEMFGTVAGAVALADSWIDHAEKLRAEQGFELADFERRTLIDKAIEKYAFNMTVCEAAAVEALEENTERVEVRRSFEEMLSDESENVDARFENGETLQVKAGRKKPQGCDLAAKVTEDDDELRVEVWEY